MSISSRGVFDRRVVALVVAAGVGVLAAGRGPVVNAQQVTGQAAKALMAACAQRAQLTNELIPLQTDRDRLKQIIKNFGFENIAAEQEALGQKADDILRDHGANAKKDYREKTLDEAKTVIDDFVDEIKDLPKPLSASQVSKLMKLSKHVPAGQQEAFINAVKELATRPVPALNGMVYTTVLKSFGTVTALTDVANSESQAEQLWKGAMMMAGEIGGGGVSILITEAEYARKNLMDLSTLAWTQYQIHKLATMTEGDLKLLKGYTDQMAKVGKRIGDVTKSLAAVAPCDSTQLAGKLEDIDPTPAQPKSSGGSPAKLIGGLAVAGGVGFGVYYALEAASAATADSSSTGSGTSSGGGGGGGSVTASTIGLGDFSCTAPGATNNLRTCTGAINVRSGTALAARAGTTIVATTVSGTFHGSFSAPTLGNTSGTVSMTASTGSACPSTQTSVQFSTVGGNAFDFVNISIPVSCR